MRGLDTLTKQRYDSKTKDRENTRTSHNAFVCLEGGGGLQSHRLPSAEIGRRPCALSIVRHAL